MKDIKKCKNNHYFLKKICPYCKEAVIETIQYREGDCISCSYLCPQYAYGCSSGFPITREEIEEKNK
jgi:hypothetical protein